MAHVGTFTGTNFTYLREAANEEYESLSDAEFAQVVGRSLGVPAELAESWLSNLGRTFQQYAPGVAQGALSGAMGGAALGPWGMLGGAMLGGLGTALGGARGGAPAPGSPRPPQAPSPGAPAGAPAAGSLMQLIANPAVQQALMSMLLGPRTGRESIEVGPSRTRVPVAAFAELLREAADQALSQYEQVGGADVAESMPDYLVEGQRQGNDTGNALVRGVLLARLLEPPFGYVPAVPAVPVTPVAPVTYGPAAPGAPSAPAAPTAPGAPAAPVGVGGFEPAPTYSTPDLGIGQQPPTQSEAMARQLARHRFQESLDAIFELNGYAS
jgi:hypothetical protein